MTYDHEKFAALRSLEVPRKIALALSDDTNPLGYVTSADIPAVADDVTDLADPSTATTEDVGTALNALLDSLRTAGVIA